jgi:hypothetical protein
MTLAGQVLNDQAFELLVINVGELKLGMKVCKTHQLLIAGVAGLQGAYPLPGTGRP